MFRWLMESGLRMKNWMKKGWIGTTAASVVLAAEMAMILDIISVLNGTALSVPKFAVMLAGLFLLIFLLPIPTGKGKRVLAAVVTAVLVVPVMVGWLCWSSVSRNVTYTAVDSGKDALYADRKVMLLVPHQDDDINVLGGVLEEYVRYGSEVYVVFSTNGDYYGLAEVRMREALDTLGYIGIPQDHVIFLGYGDQWSEAGPHIYNAQPGEVVTSAFGETKTYATAAHGIYREGRDYTKENFLADIESVILEHLPDVIYCVDYDYNIDHRALSHSFELVMGRILNSGSGYTPQVFKGYAYNTAWEAEKDFYEDNLRSAQDIFAEPYFQTPALYRWSDRVRLPVGAHTLSRSVISAPANIALSKYASQGANMYGVRVINSDKVFWQRMTTSLCYDAAVETSSGSCELLTDFMLLDSTDLLDKAHFPDDGTWIPEAGDEERQVTVRFDQPEYVDSIVLYDHPNPECNILNAVISFEDGTVLETGPLDPDGAATVIPVEKENISAFTVTLEKTEGEAGLSELEAYGEETQESPSFVKIMDENGDFAYDYWIHESGEQLFFLHAAGTAPGAASGEYLLSCSNNACAARWQENGILVQCPAGENCVVTVSSEDGVYSDSVYIQNPTALKRNWVRFWLEIEESVMNLCDTKRVHERLFVCRLYTKMIQPLCR